MAQQVSISRLRVLSQASKLPSNSLIDSSRRTSRPRKYTACSQGQQARWQCTDRMTGCEGALLRTRGCLHGRDEDGGLAAWEWLPGLGYWMGTRPIPFLTAPWLVALGVYLRYNAGV